ncbi:MAG TPA: zf-HC2 domain-containing protein [Thermoanaerobaculia bacterium]|nr:zf-HC2 domain-containing protein [Thermoanaerobaculia bacterium]
MIGNSIISVDQNCRYSDEDDVLRAYVAGRLSESAAEEFEQHLFECDRCAQEVERAVELRSVMGRREKQSPLLPLAAAAIVAAVAISLWQARPREASLTPPPLRGISGREIMASGRLVDGVFTASWKPVRGARSYRVQIFDSIGEPVTWTETSKTTVSATIGSAPPGQTRYWKVQALDDDHIVIASSELLKIQTP